MNGINVGFELTNDGLFNITIDFNEPNNDACQLFGLFLHSLEKEQNLIYVGVLKKLRNMLKENKELESIIEIIFQYKNLVQQNLDTPIMSPSQVFNKTND